MVISYLHSLSSGYLTSYLLTVAPLIFQHYRATKWGELPAEVVSAAETLGWDEQRWLYGNEPGSYTRSWASLSPEEKEAAYIMCHHDVTWPGDGKSVNLINQDDYKNNLVSGAHQVVGSISLLIPAVVAVLFVSI